MLQIIKHYIIYFFVLFQTAPLFNISTLAQNKNNKQTNWPEPVFEHLTVADGLPENSVQCILHDHLGYMWFGTQNGLVKYDGYSMKVYQPDPDDSLSISYFIVRSIYEDKSGTLWIGTGWQESGGLNKFDRATETFTSYLHNPDDSTSINNNFIRQTYEDKTEKFWVVTREGLSLFDRQNETFRRIPYKDSVYSITIGALIEDQVTGNLYVGSGNKLLILDKEKKVLIDDYSAELKYDFGIIRSFHQSKDGTIWIGHSKGLARFNPQLNDIKHYQPFQSVKDNKKNNVDHLTEDKSGNIWGACGLILTETNTELFCFDPQLESFKTYKQNTEDQNSVSGNGLWSVYIDNSENIWVGSWEGGLNKWSRKKKKFKRYSYDPADPQKNNFNGVGSISEDPSGVIWFTTHEWLYSFNRNSNKFHHYKFDPKNNGTYALYIENSNTIWFGADVRGLARFNPSNGTFKFYSHDPDDSTTISSNTVRRILPDGKDILWIATPNGLNKFDKQTGDFKRYKHDSNNPQSLSQDEIHCLLKDREGILWIATDEGGLNRFDLATESFKSLRFEGLPGVTNIYEDKKGNFWVGAYPLGLTLFDRKNEMSVYHITEKDGLANNMISSVLEDDTGNLWISTGNGLSKFNPKNKTIKNYYTSNSFASNFFPFSSANKTSTGEMLFGTHDGFIIFHPDSIKDDPVPPQVVISNVSLFNEPDKKLKFDGFISELKELNLSYNENDLRFDYVGLHYGDPGKNQYKYKLEGFDKDWIDAGTQRNATYTNLDAGEYVFRVTACNCDGVWNEQGASLKIIIPPPFWATWWAYGFYLIIFGSILYGIRKYEMNRQLWKHRMELETVEAVKYKEINRMKSHFFANVSHEFRTPLTLILGPAEKLISKFQDEDVQKQTGAIKRNANRLLGLINQLLDLSKLEAGKLELKASKQNIVPFLKGITMSFESVAERKDITLKVIPDREQIDLYFDKEKMTKIMTNLLSNAFKFTPEGGKITVIIKPSSFPPLVKGELKGGSVEIKVRDSGIGISEEELPKLFDRFYQVDSSQTREHEGTGIGLALTKELVELHKGKISVNSKPGEGTEFIIELPTGRTHLKDEEIVEETAHTEDVILHPDLVGKKNLVDNNTSDSLHFDRLGVTDSNSEGNENKNIILVVEDNSDVREFIKDSLDNQFQIEEASNGEQGVRKAEQIIPDLIISDVMMPKMDGNELTRMLKNDEKTSHIPIILLTAKSEQQSKLEGLETGADDYLTKPFDTKELQIRINNLISIRRKLQEKYSRVDFIPVKKVEEKKLSDLEEQFMSKVLQVIQTHLAEEEFSIEQFGKEVGMSRMQLHRKLKALTGKSASNYLRSIRLNKAKKMIEEQKGSISEIAYSVGFSSPQYFTRSFKDEFGYPPSEML